jgi:hypothetical protein
LFFILSCWDVPWILSHINTVIKNVPNIKIYCNKHQWDQVFNWFCMTSYFYITLLWMPLSGAHTWASLNMYVCTSTDTSYHMYIIFSISTTLWFNTTSNVKYIASLRSSFFVLRYTFSTSLCLHFLKTLDFLFIYEAEALLCKSSWSMYCINIVYGLRKNKITFFFYLIQ